MKLVVCSDLHLDAPFAWARPGAARALRQEIRRAFARIAEIAREREADALLCAGDLYEHERASADTAEFLRHTFAGLSCPVIVTPGNHDPFVSDSLYARTRWPDNVHIFSEPSLAPLSLSDEVTLWGAAHVRPRGTPGFFEGGFRAGGKGVHIGLFHGSERGYLAFEGEQKVGHAPFGADHIARAGLRHAFVGHYHTPRLEKAFTYPGAPAFLSFGAPLGGAVLAEITKEGDLVRELFTVASLKAWDLELDVTGLTTVEAIRERACELLADRRGIARITVRGEIPTWMDFRPSHDLAFDMLGDAAEGLFDVQVRAEKLASSFDIDAIAGEHTVRGEFVRRVLAAELDETTRQQVLTAGLRALEGREDLEVVP